jgi:1,2-diacylglycerol 3-alpha-glucosyltransferase
MKVAVASSGLGHVTRGIESWASDLAGALDELDTPVVLFKGGGSADLPFERVSPCLQRGDSRTLSMLRFTRRFFWRVRLGSTYDIEQVTFGLNLLNQLRAHRFDILHVSDPVVALLVQRAQTLGLVPTRAVLAHQTNEPNAFLGKIRYLQHLAPWHLEQAQAAGVSKPTWTSIPNFVDAQRFRPGPVEGLRDELGIPKHGLIVLSAAAIKRNHKRVDFLLDEFAELLRVERDLPAWLVVAGGWEHETDELVHKGREMLGDRVRFLVRFPRERMAELYRLADVFALSSLREMMPIAILEAIASGLPCLVHRHPILEWMIGPGGEAIDMTSRGSLTSALSRMLRNDARRRILSGFARDHCLSNFEKHTVIRQYLSYYASLGLA